MTVRYIDAHCHLQFAQYDEDRDALITQMLEEGIAGIVVGCDYDSSIKAVELAERHDHLYAAVGLHPNHGGDEAYDAENYRRLARSPKVVAIGECGLDYYRTPQANTEDSVFVFEKQAKEQKSLFNDQIQLAAELDKPLVVHSRPSRGTQNAYEDVIAILTEAKKVHPNLRGDMHFFVGGLEEARALIALDFTLSFTAVITFAREYDAVIASAPPGSILSETDAPYVAPLNRRGSRNDPLSVKDVVQAIARIRNEEEEMVRKALVANARRLYGLP